MLLITKIWQDTFQDLDCEARLKSVGGLDGICISRVGEAGGMYPGYIRIWVPYSWFRNDAGLLPQHTLMQRGSWLLVWLVEYGRRNSEG